MNAVVGIAAKSLDAAHELAKVLNGSQAWGHRESLALNAEGDSAETAAHVPARALLLLSRDFRTAYVLVATHATAVELLKAASAAANAAGGRGQAGSSGYSDLPCSAEPAEPAASAAVAANEPDTTVGATPGARAPLPPPPPLPPVLRVQQCHSAAVNVLLLQLFLTCDCVLVVLPTGQGLGASSGGGGGDGGPLTGATDWISRLRLLQGAKRALQHGLGSDPSAAKQLLLPPQQQQRQPLLYDPGDAGPTKGVLPLLRGWCSRAQPPALYFVSPSDPPLAHAAPRNVRDPLRTAARGGAATGGSTDPRDANWVLRNLLKRCRPLATGIAAGATDTAALCTFDPQTLVLEPGPLALSPGQVHAVVLAALLCSEEGDGGPFAAAAPPEIAAGSPGADDGLLRLRDVVAAATAACCGTGGGGWRRLGVTEHAVYDSTAAASAAAAQRFAAAWRAAAARLHEAAVAAWEDAVRQPLDWIAPGLAALSGARQAAVASSPSPSSSFSVHLGTSQGRGRTRANLPGAAAAAANAATASPQSTSPGPGPLDATAAWLAAGSRGGGGLAARMAEEISQAAADSALQSYLYGTPKRYPARVHAAAVAAAVAAARAAAPPGPAAAAATTRLRAACAEAWLQGRQQCSALSATGRPCTRPVHCLSEPHCSDTTRWCTATTTGSGFVLVPDPFDVQAANAAAGLDDGERVAVQFASQPSAQLGHAGSGIATGGGRQKAGKKAGAAGLGATGPAAEAAVAASAAAGATPAQPPPPAHSRHLMVAACQGPDGVVRQCALGPWVTVTRLGAASAYSERRGLINQPGLNGSQLFTLTLQMDSEAGAGTRSASAGRHGARGGGGGGGGGVGGKASAATPAAASAGSDTPDATGGGDAEAAAGVVLDEQSFPSLAAAVAAAQAGRQQAAGPGGPSGGRRGATKQTQQGGPKAAGGDAAAVVSREREGLARVWPYPHGSGIGSRGSAGGDGAVRSVAAGGGGGAPMRGRRTRGPAGAAAGGTDAEAFPALHSNRDVRRVYVSYEYQTLDGRRFLATPQQLAAAAAAAAAAERAAAGASPPSGAIRTPTPAAGPPLPDRAPKPTRGGPTPTNPDPSSAAAARVPAAATPASSTLGAGGGANGAACYLLQHDAPLYLQPPPGLVPDVGAPEAQDGAPAWDPTPRRPGGLAQLQRIFIATPPSSSGAPLLASRPTIQFRVLQPLKLPADAAEVMAATSQQGPVGGAAGTSVTTTSTAGAQLGRSNAVDSEGVVVQQSGTRQDERERGMAASMVAVTGVAFTSAVQVSLARPVPLPPDSFMVITLPFAYGLPAQWLGWDVGEGADGASRCHGSAAQVAPPSGLRADEDGEHGGVAAAAGFEGASCGSVERVSHARMLPLVQLEERSPFDVRLLAGSALFPIPTVPLS